MSIIIVIMYPINYKTYYTADKFSHIFILMIQMLKMYLPSITEIHKKTHMTINYMTGV